MMSNRYRAVRKTSGPDNKSSGVKTQNLNFSQSTNSPFDQILYLQRTVGNRAVEKLIKQSGGIQDKIAVNRHGDMINRYPWGALNEWAIARGEKRKAAKTPCWKKEGFSGKSKYDKAKKEWKKKEPSGPPTLGGIMLGPFVWYAPCIRWYKNDAIKGAKRVCKNASPKDKCLHCVVGCCISKKCSPRHAEYAAWYKEWKDLTDCDGSSHFEKADYDATVDGIDWGADPETSTKMTSDCEARCRKYGAKYQRTKGGKLNKACL